MADLVLCFPFCQYAKHRLEVVAEKVVFWGTTLSSITTSGKSHCMFSIRNRREKEKKSVYGLQNTEGQRWSQELHLRYGEFVNSRTQAGNTSTIASLSNQSAFPALSLAQKGLQSRRLWSVL